MKGKLKFQKFLKRNTDKPIKKNSDDDIVDRARDYRLMKKEMADIIVAMGEQNRFSKGVFGWIGCQTYWYAFENVKRAELFCLGVIGQHIGKTYAETKKRPYDIVSECSEG